MKNKNAKHFTRGGQITLHNYRMLLQVYKKIGLACFIIFLVIFIVSSLLMTPYDTAMNALYYAFARALHALDFDSTVLIVSFQGEHFKQTPLTILSHPYFYECVKTVWKNVVISSLLASSVSFMFFVGIARWLTQRGKSQAEANFIRGMVKEKASVVKKRIRKRDGFSDLHVDDFPLPKGFEQQHVLIHGTTGAGKSQMMMKLLDGLRKRQDKLIIYDKGCSFIKRYFNPDRDIILNPFDQRCAAWDLWSDGREAGDFDNMASALIPLPRSGDPFWADAARTIFSSAAYKMRTDPKRSMHKLIELLLTAPLADLKHYLHDTESASLVNDKIARTATTIKAMLATYVKGLRFLQGVNADGKIPFSLRDWIRDETSSGWIFITANEDQQNSLRPLMTLWLAMATQAILSLPENPQRNRWLFLDELPTLHQLPRLASDIAEGRKFGSRFVIGVQSHAQLRTVYGSDEASAITDLLNTRFFFRNPSQDVAQWSSRELGEQEIDEVKENYSYGANTIRDGISLGRQRRIEPLVSPSEMMNLPDLQCYARLIGYPVTQLSLKYDDQRPIIAQHFMPRELLLDKNLETLIHSYLAFAPLTVQTVNSDATIMSDTTQSEVIEKARDKKSVNHSNSMHQKIKSSFELTDIADAFGGD